MMDDPIDMGPEDGYAFDFLGRPLPPPEARKPRGTTAMSKEPNEVSRAKKALLRRAKSAERERARWTILHDGPDPKYRGLTTSTGRVGHVTALQFDILSRSYCGEVKNARLSAGLAKAWALVLSQPIAGEVTMPLNVAVARIWQQVAQVSEDWRKEPLLIWKPSNADKFKVFGKPLPDLHVITEGRHAELLKKEQIADALG